MTLPPLLKRCLPPALIWAACWGLMLRVDAHVELANLVLLLVLAATLSTLWLPLMASMVLSLLAVLAFNWRFVSPERSMELQGWSHVWLLATMLALSWLVAVLLSRLRREADAARRHAEQADQLRALGQALRDSRSPVEAAQLLQTQLDALLPTPAPLLLGAGPLPADNRLGEGILLIGEPDGDQLAGLWACWRQGVPFGPGTGRYRELSAWYLPLRGRAASHGAALLILPDATQPDPELCAHAQSLCDQMGLALERQSAEHAARRAHDEAEGQATRNALLAAISHDYRTPLATIMGAASSLLDQGERQTPAQRHKLLATVLDETRQLSRMTDNTLQLARLERAGLQLRTDWEAAEEVVGAALRRVRQRHPQAAQRVRLRVASTLPLLQCDAVLLAQLLDNLLDNALRYAPEGPIELLVRHEPGGLLLAVRDRGPGVPPAARARIFEPFQRGEELDRERPDATGSRRGAGVGLAACRAIAIAHGGTLGLRARSHGGASFECRLPVQAQPDAAPAPAPEAPTPRPDFPEPFAEDAP